MPRRKELPPEEWLRRMNALNEMFAELREAFERQRDLLWSKINRTAVPKRPDDDLAVQDLKSVGELYVRAIALERQWLEALACKAHQLGLPNMYGPGGRPKKAPWTDYGKPRDTDIKRVLEELVAARKAKNASRLARALVESYHISPNVLDQMPEESLKSLKSWASDQSTKYIDGMSSQSAFNLGHLKASYAERLHISVSSLERIAKGGRASSKR